MAKFIRNSKVSSNFNRPVATTAQIHIIVMTKYFVQVGRTKYGIKSVLILDYWKLGSQNIMVYY